MDTKILVPVLVLFIAVGTGIAFYPGSKAADTPSTAPEMPGGAPAAPKLSPAAPEHPVDIESYVRDSINQLSPIDPVLGGTFFVTEIEISADGTGEVEYEDGHAAIKADFTYRISPDGQPDITSFVVREE